MAQPPKCSANTPSSSQLSGSFSHNIRLMRYITPPRAVVTPSVGSAFETPNTNSLDTGRACDTNAGDPCSPPAACGAGSDGRACSTLSPGPYVAPGSYACSSYSTGSASCASRGPCSPGGFVVIVGVGV